MMPRIPLAQSWINLGRVDLPYPARSKANIVLRNSRTAHLRPIQPEDAERFARFHERLLRRDDALLPPDFSLYRGFSDP